MSGAGTAAALYTATVSPPAIVGAIPEDQKDKKHHLKNGTFSNPWESFCMMSSPQIAKTMVGRRIMGTANSPDTTPPTVTVRKPEFLPTRTTPTLRATWLGHACYLVEFPSGFRVLFDPVFTERCGPLSWLGPKRYTDIPCQIEDLPIVDAVVISHNHYDHLSHPTILKIYARHPNVHFFVPLKNKQWFAASNINPAQVTELDWWEDVSIKLDGLESKAENANAGSTGRPDAITAQISCLPCQHVSARSPFDKNHTLWASWSVESGGKKVWFAGDTGYRSVPALAKEVDDYGEGHVYPRCPAFAQIGKLRGPFDLGMIPIGAYDPRWVMSPMHANPFDSVEIFKDTQCRRALAMHWGTWVLTEEDVLEPPVLLKKALAKSSLPEVGVFDICEIGESIEIS